MLNKAEIIMSTSSIHTANNATLKSTIINPLNASVALI